MRTQTTKRIHNQPMKSPSPDIVNRNGIKHTKVEINDVHRYIDKNGGRQSRSPTVNNQVTFQNGASFSEVQFLKQKINDLEYKNQQLQAQNHSLSGLVDINSRLNNQLSQMRETLKSQSFRQLSPRVNNEQLAMKDRLIQLMQENKRIVKKLQEKDANCREIQKENQKNKNEIFNLKYLQSVKGDETQGINQAKEYFENHIEAQFKKSQLIWMNRLRELQQKISTVQKLQFALENKLFAINKKKQETVFTPIKYTHQTQDSRRTVLPSEQSEKSKPKASFINDSPFLNQTREQEKLRLENQKLSDQIYFLQDQLENSRRQLQSYKRQLDNSRRKCSDLEEDKWKLQSEVKNASFYRSRIEYLESQLDSKNMKISSLESDLRFERQQLNRAKDKLENSNYLLENEMNSYKKALDQQRQKSSKLQLSLIEMTQKCKNLEETAIDPQENERQKQRIQTYFENQITRTRNYYEEILREKDNQISISLRNYLEALRSIKRGLQEANLDQILTENENMINEKVTIEAQLTLIKEENEKIINEMKRKLILQEQRIIQLEKDNQILHNEINELHKQKQKLKKAMIEFQEVKMTPTLQTSTYQSEGGMQKAKKYNYKLKGCLKQTIEKIDNLQEKITRILKQ